MAMIKRAICYLLGHNWRQLYVLSRHPAVFCARCGSYCTLALHVGKTSTHLTR